MSDIPDIKKESQLVSFINERFPSIDDVYNIEMFNYRFYFTYTLRTPDVMPLKELLFKGMTGCLSNDCIITDNSTGTNSSCKCLLNMSRGQLAMLNSRLNQLKDKEIVL